MFVLQRAQEPLDYAVGLWAPHPCADVTEQRVIAGERVSEGHATKAWPIVRHDGDRSGCFTDHVVVGVDDVHHAAVAGTGWAPMVDVCRVPRHGRVPAPPGLVAR